MKEIIVLVLVSMQLNAQGRVGFTCEYLENGDGRLKNMFCYGKTSDVKKEIKNCEKSLSKSMKIPIEHIDCDPKTPKKLKDHPYRKNMY